MKQRNDWHLLEKEKILGLLGTDLYKGLDNSRVRKHRMRWGSNPVWHVRHTSAKDIALSAVFDLATVLLLISAAAAALFDRGVEAGLIAAVLLAAGLLRTMTYIRAQRIMEDIAGEKIPVVSVIREGRAVLIPASEIVIGDIVYLEEGDRVPCDGRVIAGEDSLVDERGITENKKPVHKFETVISTESAGGEVPCEYRSNCVFAGSRVLKGSLRIVATAVGKNTLIAMKQGGIEIEPEHHLPMVQSLAVRSRNTSLVMLACVLIFTALSLFAGNAPELIDVFLGTMAMAAAAMSEFFTMIGTIIVAVTVRECASGAERRSAGKSVRSRKPKDHIADSSAKSRTVIREPGKLERIAGIRKIVFFGSSFFKSGRMELCAYHADGVFAEFDGTKNEYTSKDGTAVPSAVNLLKLTMAASASENRSLAGADSRSREASEMTGYILRGVDAYVKKSGQSLDYGFGLMEHMDACSKSAGLHISLIMDNGRVRCAACGKIDAVLRACTMAEWGGKTVPMTDEIRREIYTECAKLEFSGARVIGTAHRLSPFDQLNRVSVLTEYMTFAGFIAVSQEWEKNAAENISFLYRDGICPVLFTEEPEADLYYCYRLGLFDKRTKIVSAAEVTEETFRKPERGVIVSFAGLEPLHEAYAAVMQTVMQSEENCGTVAAIGRKLRDASAIEKAEVGCTAADSPVRAVPGALSGRSVLVIHPPEKETEARFGGLDGLIRTIHASRQAMENVESAKLYLTAAQCARLLLMLAAILLPVPMLSPVWILVWGLLFDFAAVLVMAFEHGNGQRLRTKSGSKKKPADGWDELEEEKTRDLRGIGAPLLIGLLWAALTAGGAFLYDLLASLSGLSAAGQCGLCVSLILSGLIVSCGIMKPGSFFRPERINGAYVSFAAAAVVLLAAALLTSDLLWLERLLCLGVSLIPAILILVFFELSKRYLMKKDR